MILEVFCSGPFETNAILLACPKTHQAAWIDAPEGCYDIVMRRAKVLGVHINMLLLTHSHQDHIAEAAMVQKLGIPIYIHREDVGNLEAPGSDGLPLMISVDRATPDHFLEEGQILQIGELELVVLHTPGHTPGGVCFYLPKEKVLISGDTLFAGAIGNLQFPTARPNSMWASLKRLADLPLDTRVFPGHGESTTIGKEQWIREAKNQR